MARRLWLRGRDLLVWVKVPGGGGGGKVLGSLLLNGNLVEGGNGGCCYRGLNGITNLCGRWETAATPEQMGRVTEKNRKSEL